MLPLLVHSPFVRARLVQTIALRFVAAVLLLRACSGAAIAQTSPQIGYLFPAGAQRGATVAVEVGGKYMPGPCGIWVGGTGVTPDRPTTEGNVTLRVDSMADLGVYPVRIHSVQGGSSVRPFVVGELPEVMESPAEVQDVELKTTVNGRLFRRGDIDRFRLTLSKGQQVVCAAAVESLGSPGDVMLRMLDPAGRVLATAFDHFDRNPKLVFRCPADGRYTLELYDYKLSGGSDFVYRLTVTDGPFLDYAFPAGASRTKKSTVTLFGWNLAGGDSMPYEITPDDLARDEVTVHLPNGANRLTMPVGDTAEVVESEAEQPQAVETPVTINGRLQAAGDTDTFRFAAVKGEKLALNVESAALGFPTDLVMQIFDDAGKMVREVDDVGSSRDPGYEWTVPADGNYLVTIKERADRGGPRFVYRLRIGPVRPSLRLSAKTKEFTAVPGGSLSVAVRVEPAGGFADEIQLRATGLPPGIVTTPVTHTPKKAGDIKLEFQVDAGAMFASAAFGIEAVMSSGGDRVLARVDDLWLAIGPKVPFELTTVSAIQEAPRLAAFPFPVRVQRVEGFTAAIKLVGVEPDRRGTVVPLDGAIEAGDDVGSIPLIIQADTTEGTTHRCRVMGVVEVAGPDGKLHRVFHVAKGSMAMGCQPNYLTLTTQPKRLVLRPEEAAEVELQIARRVAMGAVSVGLAPSADVPGVVVEPTVIESNGSTGTIVIRLQSGSRWPPMVRIPLRASSSRGGLPIYAESTLTVIPR